MAANGNILGWSIQKHCKKKDSNTTKIGDRRIQPAHEGGVESISFQRLSKKVVWKKIVDPSQCNNYDIPT